MASEDIKIKRVASLVMDGFTNDEIAILKHTRITPHMTDTGKSSTVYNLRRRRRTQVAAYARSIGLNPKNFDHFARAADLYRKRAQTLTDRWKDDYEGLPPEYDPIALMGYAKYA